MEVCVETYLQSGINGGGTRHCDLYKACWKPEKGMIAGYNDRMAADTRTDSPELTDYVDIWRDMLHLCGYCCKISQSYKLPEYNQ